jgi:hypothetical protein
VGHNPQTIPLDRAGFDEAGGHLIAFVLELFVSQANIIKNNRLAIGEIMRIAADDIVYGEVLESHFCILSFVFCPKENNKKSNRLSKYNCVFGCKKFQAPNHKLQTISKFQAPMIQTGFDSSEAFGMWSDRMWLAAYS